MKLMKFILVVALFDDVLSKHIVNKAHMIDVIRNVFLGILYLCVICMNQKQIIYWLKSQIIYIGEDVNSFLLTFMFFVCAFLFLFDFFLKKMVLKTFYWLCFSDMSLWWHHPQLW